MQGECMAEKDSVNVLNLSKVIVICVMKVSSVISNQYVLRVHLFR